MWQITSTTCDSTCVPKRGELGICGCSDNVSHAISACASGQCKLKWSGEGVGHVETMGGKSISEKKENSRWSHSSYFVFNDQSASQWIQYAIEDEQTRWARYAFPLDWSRNRRWRGTRSQWRNGAVWSVRGSVDRKLIETKKIIQISNECSDKYLVTDFEQQISCRLYIRLWKSKNRRQRSCMKHNSGDRRHSEISRVLRKHVKHHKWDT